MCIRLTLIAALLSVSSAAYADTLTCSLAGYRALPGLVASVANDTLTVTWRGDQKAELRVRFTINGGTPTIAELATRRQGGQWRTLATNVTPEFRVASGLRRVSNQQIGKASVAGLGGELTKEVYDKIKWEGWVRFAAWDVARNGAIAQPVKLNGAAAR